MYLRMVMRVTAHPGSSHASSFFPSFPGPLDNGDMYYIYMHLFSYTYTYTNIYFVFVRYGDDSFRGQPPLVNDRRGPAAGVRALRAVRLPRQDQHGGP